MSYTHLTAQERYVISHLKGSVSIREIARRLNRHHTTISREFHRAKSRHPLTNVSTIRLPRKCSGKRRVVHLQFEFTVLWIPSRLLPAWEDSSPTILIPQVMFPGYRSGSKGLPHRLCQVLDQVVYLFDAGGEAQERV